MPVPKRQTPNPNKSTTFWSAIIQSFAEAQQIMEAAAKWEEHERSSKQHAHDSKARSELVKALSKGLEPRHGKANRRRQDARWLGQHFIELAEREAFEEDAARIDRVRVFLCAAEARRKSELPPLADFLFVIGALIDAHDIDCPNPRVRALFQRQIRNLRRLYPKTTWPAPGSLAIH